MLVYSAAMQAGSDRGKIRDYLASLTDATAYKGATGTIRFRPDGDPVGQDVVMTRIDGGVLHVAEAGK